MALDQNSSVGAETPCRASKLQIKFRAQDTIFTKLIDFASLIPDFRRTGKGNLRHNLADIIILLIFAHMCGYESRAGAIAFGKHNLNKLRGIGLFSNGIPSEPTLCRIEKGINVKVLAQKMWELTTSSHTELWDPRKVDIICIDGKAMRGTVQDNGRSPDIVSAYSSSTQLTLATQSCDEKSNEIKAVQLLLDRLDIEGQVITADAMSMQKAILDKLREKKADFVIELKANPRALRYGIEDRIKHHRPIQTYSEGPVLAHGRIETRTYRIYDGLPLIADKGKWAGDLTVISFEAQTVQKSTGKRTSEERLYVSSIKGEASYLGKMIRTHWSIESMHWSLDCNFHQDRIKRKYTKASRNLDTLQRMAHAMFSIWRGKRQKRVDKENGIAELRRDISCSFTKLMRFLAQS